MSNPDEQHKKRQVPQPLLVLLKTDVVVTNAFCQIFDRMINPIKFRKHFKVLEISCHALPWLALTLASIWFLWRDSLFQSQVNFMMGLLFDIMNISLLKAFVRRRRPVGDHSDMFFTVGPDQYSFPSGHVSRAIFVTGFFIGLYPSAYILHIVLISWAIAVSISRILLRRHHILDVLGGIILGLAESWLLAVMWLSKSTALWLVSAISDEATNLEGVDDFEGMNVEDL